MTDTQGNVPFFLIGRRKTLSPEVTYSVWRSGPPKTTLEGLLRSGLLRMPTVLPAGSTNSLSAERSGYCAALLRSGAARGRPLPDARRSRTGARSAGRLGRLPGCRRQFGGTATDLMNAGSSISAFISPLAAAWLYTSFGSFDAMFMSAAAVYLVSGFVAEDRRSSTDHGRGFGGVTGNMTIG